MLRINPRLMMIVLGLGAGAFTACDEDTDSLERSDLRLAAPGEESEAPAEHALAVLGDVLAPAVFGPVDDPAFGPMHGDDAAGARAGDPGQRGAPRPGARALRLARHCDPDPEIVEAEYCGRTYRAAANFAWSDCEVQRPHHPAVTASGTANQEMSLAGDCTPEGTAMERRMVFAIDRVLPGDRRVHVASTVQMSKAPGDGDRRTVAIDRRRELGDADGIVGNQAVTASLEMVGDVAAGSMQVSGAVSVARTGPKGERSADMQLVGLEFRGPRACRLPVGGHVELTLADGDHLLEFGPECGDVRFDGEVIDPPDRPRKGPHHD